MKFSEILEHLEKRATKRAELRIAELEHEFSYKINGGGEPFRLDEKYRREIVEREITSVKAGLGQALIRLAEEYVSSQ